MKKLYLLVVLFFSCIASSQFNLEHTYNNEAGIVRVNLENSGEKYYGINNETQTLVLYNADHTLWKSIPLITPTNTGSIYIRHVSESKINPDANIEVIYYCSYFVGSAIHNVGKVISENGTQILTSDDTDDIILSEIQDFSNKIIANTTNQTSRVYDLSGNLEHFYSEGLVKRSKLENSGDKYYLLDRANGVSRVFNSDHSLWKTIPLPKPAAATYNYVTFISETLINSDALLEIAYTYRQSTFETRLINENGELLLSVSDCSGLHLSHLDGCADKLVTRLTASGSATSYYSLPSLALEHVYPTITQRVLMDNVIEKYFTVYNDNEQFVIYNMDHSVWKSITLNKPANASLREMLFVSQTRVNDDPLVEFSYGYSVPLGSGRFYYECKMINELGDVLLTVPDCLNLYIYGAPNFETEKLIGLKYIENVMYFASVYGLNALAVKSQHDEQQCVVYPNPVDNTLYINANEIITDVEIYNQLGMLVRKVSSFSIVELSTLDLSEGMYLIKITDRFNKKSTQKIVVSR